MADSSDASSAPHPDLLALRTQIDGLDRELLALLNRRANLAQQVGELKKKEGSVVFRPEREAQVIDGLKAVNGGPLKSESVARQRRSKYARRSLSSSRPRGVSLQMTMRRSVSERVRSTSPMETRLSSMRVTVAGVTSAVAARSPLESSACS